ncbi:SDR family oxidoreductase [Formosa sp. S-31]|uniref:SDR family oxidoreductase n=1 Tax=Formosa sp. S-31 TaxID=2790949 RepID=UPI003EBA4B76
MILVTGSSGHLGAAVVNELLNRVEAKNIAVMARDVSKLSEFKALGVEVRQGDYNDLKSLILAFKDVDKLYFVSGSDIEKRNQQHINVVDAAKEAGVKHIIYTSFQRKTEAKDSVIGFIANSHIDTEEYIKASGIPYTILKHALYMEVIPLFIGQQVLESGVVYIPTEDGKVNFTSRQDLAEGAAKILTTNGHENKYYEFGSDVAVSMEDIAQILSKLSGKNISFVSPTTQDFVKTLGEIGVPKPAIDITLGFSAGIAAGEFNAPTTTLKDLLGHELINIPTFLEATYLTTETI